MNGKIRVAMIGCGQFARCFVPLFKAHPEVEKVWVCDLLSERAKEYSDMFDVEIMESFEEALSRDDVNAVAIFTQRYSHGPLVIQALKAGKHVYSAVPCGITVEEIFEIEKLVRETRLTYSMGETGYYRAAAIYCRQEFAKGTFGKFVYGEAQYNHDIRNMETSFGYSGGENWKKFAGIPPFFYPTHSTSMVLSTMPGVYVKSVSALGYRDVTRPEIFGEGDVNYYNNPFGNETMLCELSNGGVMRISENRAVGWKCPETYITQFYGTEGGYEYSFVKHTQTKWSAEDNKQAIATDVSHLLFPKSVTKIVDEDYNAGLQAVSKGTGFHEMSPIQDNKRLPESYRGLKNGHNGTHHYLIDDFCKAVATGKLSPTNIWETARYNLPGLVAHESSMNGGVRLPVPDLGEHPSDWEVIEPYDFEYNQK